jgi:hypothetical protein
MTPEFIDECVNNAINCKSKCSQEILDIEGMSGKMTRHLYNNICSLDNINYLEIGCHRGSSTMSALYLNKNVKATIIDNWSEFGGPKEEFMKNIDKFIPDNIINVLNQDSFQVNLTDKFDVYLYDGHHSVDSHRKAITYFWNNLKERCIVMVDDYNWDMVKEGTLKGFEEMNANILYKKVISAPQDGNGFWNGCGIFLIQK